MSFISSLMAKDSVNTLDALNAFNQEMGVTEAQQKAIDLGIYEIVRNVALNGGDMYIPTEVEWEGCRVIFDEAIRQQQMQQQQQRQWPQAKPFFEGTCVVHPNGELLYQALQKGKDVKAFRYGAWVERIKAYSEQITLEKQQAAYAKAEQERLEKLKPFTQIDF